MSVGRISTRTVATASPGEMVTAVAERMAEYNVGTVVVVDDGRKPVGMVTDRDIVLRCVAGGHDADQTSVSTIMTRDVRSVDESLPIEQALRTMASAEARRLVVTGDGGELAGIVALDDIVELLAEEATTIGRLLRKESPRLDPL